MPSDSDNESSQDDFGGLQSDEEIGKSKKAKAKQPAKKRGRPKKSKEEPAKKRSGKKK